MKRAYSFNINYALNYTCHRLVGDEKSIDFCGHCNSCQIINNLNNMKQWFERASHITVKKLLIGLLVRIENMDIYCRLSDLLRPLTQSKDFIYARNKYLPSCDEDHSKPTNNRCLDADYVNKQVSELWAWYQSANEFIKLNFMVSLLMRSDLAVVFLVILKLNSLLDAYEAKQQRLQANQSNIYDYVDRSDVRKRTALSLNHENTQSEMVYDTFDMEEENVNDYLNGTNADASQLGGGGPHDDYNPNSFYHDSYLKDLKYVDFIRQLPVHLSKLILKYLNVKSLYNCLFVCKYWANLIKEVRKEEFLHRILLDDMMLLKGTSSKNYNPKFANNLDVKVPNLVPGTYEVRLNASEPLINVALKSECSWHAAYSGYSTRNVIIEERNVFCGAYNVLLLKEKRDPHRFVHYSGPNLAAYCSFDNKMRFVDVRSTTEVANTIQGHVGSIRAIYVCERKRLVFTGSYDTSLRCWHIDTGKCVRIYQGHQQTITCLAMHENDEHERLISGSSDRTCRIWNVSKSKAWRTFKHMYKIVSVAMGEELAASGGQTGKIKLFHIVSGTLIKTLSAHNGPVRAIRFDRWHLLSCSSDGYALLFSTQGKHKKCLMAMRHPKEVLCLEFQYLRAITGAADGKIRIWNVMNGDCIRVIRSNSLCDPVLSMSIVDNKILVNTENNIVLMEFERIRYEYETSRHAALPLPPSSVAATATTLTAMSDSSADSRHRHHHHQRTHTRTAPPTTPTAPTASAARRSGKNYASIRASRMELVSTPNPKLFEDGRKSALEHSARPISAKNLKDAHIVHEFTTRRPVTIVRNSIGNVSESALRKHHTLVENIKHNIHTRQLSSTHQHTSAMHLAAANAAAAAAAQHASDLDSSYCYTENYLGNRANAYRAATTTTNATSTTASGDEIRLSNEVGSVVYELLDAATTGSRKEVRIGVVEKKKSELNETKDYLRDQLREMRQQEQLEAHGERSSSSIQFMLNAHDETRSCIDTIGGGGGGGGGSRACVTGNESATEELDEAETSNETTRKLNVLADRFDWSSYFKRPASSPSRLGERNNARRLKERRLMAAGGGGKRDSLATIKSRREDTSTEAAHEHRGGGGEADYDSDRDSRNNDESETIDSSEEAFRMEREAAVQSSIGQFKRDQRQTLSHGVSERQLLRHHQQLQQQQQQQQQQKLNQSRVTSAAAANKPLRANSSNQLRVVNSDAHKQSMMKKLFNEHHETIDIVSKEASLRALKLTRSKTSHDISRPQHQQQQITSSTNNNNSNKTQSSKGARVDSTHKLNAKFIDFSTACKVNFDARNKLSSMDNNNLNLKTHREMDMELDKVSGGFRNEALDKEAKRADVYKKMWTLKSKGVYHGNLFAKPKVIAPEIRE